MIWTHRLSWAGMALVAFMVIPIIKGERDVMIMAHDMKACLKMSLAQLSNEEV